MVHKGLTSVLVRTIGTSLLVRTIELVMYVSLCVNTHLTPFVAIRSLRFPKGQIGWSNGKK